ncbi:acyl-CoA N-acyltransferase, partial [Plenodomus tracheiphilus IPT5]
PFTSPHLHYRAIRPTHDLPLFTAINADQTGYPNSNISNAKLPGATDALTYLTHCSTATLLGAIIWLPHPPSLKGRFLTNEIARLKRVEDAKGIHGTLVEDCGIAIGEIHLSLLPTHSSHHRHTELGIGILPAWQGCGYGGEAIGWAVEYAFLRVGLHRVGVRAFGWNERAVRLYERLGFCVEGREREAFWWEGGWWDGVLLGVLEGEWRARRE